MSRTFALLLTTLSISTFASSAMLPETIGHWQHGDATFAEIPDQAVWQEYGLQESEKIAYADSGKKFSLSAYRFTDATGALAAFYQLRPADAKPIQIMGLGAQSETRQLLTAGNYLFMAEGYRLLPEEFSHLFATAPKYAKSPLPTLPKYLPPGANPNSERYVSGPVSLEKFVSAVPPSVAAFRFSAEAALATYGAGPLLTTIVVFSYPTPEMARDRYTAFSQLPGVLVKRSGPLVALTVAAPNADTAEKLLAQVKYAADVTVPHQMPGLKENPANLLWNIVILCGVLIALCLASGLVFGGIRILFRRGGADGEENEMVSLHLSGKP